MDIEDFVPISFEGRVALRGPGGPQECLKAFLDNLLGALVDAGCTAVGHVKGMMTGGGGEPLFFSITTLENNLRFQGGPLGDSDTYTLTMNVIVAGLEERVLTKTFSTVLRGHFNV